MSALPIPGTTPGGGFSFNPPPTTTLRCTCGNRVPVELPAGSVIQTVHHRQRQSPVTGDINLTCVCGKRHRLVTVKGGR